tara:strand:- start:758 stop:970 length:213 start_codon:yes stop_codon:yes gene_type:complete
MITKKQALKKITTARERAGLSQHQAAEKAGISQPAWHYIEAGTNQPHWETLFLMAKAVGLDIRLEFTAPG